ncbi:cob(I)alamin adenosyltransferase [Caldanaerobius fijiensis DSM 17918]|uniref:Corrinoid adenosyltransferase n=1 Tax=Caldanaerobius fijiensis DSM 17918 TaxID=1121256 RepID=A0A1M4UFH2_9THEO|nr:cob(I)yrinic acid a,c-diamide adenosyltransferase [Caldanaerobius fijiensis]SHE55445.1 cob(I)alamin adenosyltransferase [Caldanaerobius fijiensis DSM 17918]
MKIYTRTGDDGTTSIAKNIRLPKDDIRIELLGSLDELNSALGIVKLYVNEEIKNIIEEFQRDMLNIGANIAGFDKNISPEKITYIEDLIDKYQQELSPQTGFIIPGKTFGSTYMDFARTIARKAERKAVALKKDGIKPEILKYLNRLSDLLYILARYIDHISLSDVVYANKKDNKRNGYLSLDVALKLIMVSQVLAREMGIPIVSAIADEAGNLIAFQRMDGAMIASINIAIDKAYSASILKMSTEEIGSLAQPGGPLYGINTTNDHRIITFGGGYPLKNKEVVIGGVGISGGTAEQDSQIAKAVALSCEEVMKGG